VDGRFVYSGELQEYGRKFSYSKRKTIQVSKKKKFKTIKDCQRWIERKREILKIKKIGTVNLEFEFMKKKKKK